MADTRAKIGLACQGAGAAAILVTAWLPFQATDWTAWRMAGGYDLAGGRLAGPLVGAFPLIPHLVGLIVLGAGLLAPRRPCVASGILGCVAILWGAVLIRFEFALAGLPDLRHPWLWPSLAGACLALLSPVTWFGLAARRTRRGVGLLRLVLVMGAWAQLSGRAAFAWVEDEARLSSGAGSVIVGLAALSIGVWMTSRGADG